MWGMYFMKKQTKYAYTFDGKVLYETVDALKMGARRKLWRFPSSLVELKDKFKLAKIEVNILEYVEDDKEQKDE